MREEGREIESESRREEWRMREEGREIENERRIRRVERTNG